MRKGRAMRDRDDQTEGRGEEPAPTGDEKPRLEKLKEGLRTRQQQATEKASGLAANVREGASSARQQASELAGSAKEGASAASKRAGELLGLAWSRTGEATASAVDWSRDLPTRFRELFVRDCAVPVLLLPTGPGAADFTCRFEFADAVDQLQSGILVRPRLDVWAGREDVDRRKLATILKDQFRAQLDEQRRRALQEKSPALKEMRQKAAALEKRRDEEGEKLGASMATVSAALVAMFLFANPLFDLLFLTMAFFGSGEAIKRFGSWFSVTFSSGASMRKVEREEKRLTEELDQEFSASSDTFRSAVDNLEVHVHPLLHGLVRDFGEVELVGVPASDRGGDGDIPVVTSYLLEGEYVAQVPAHLRVLVEAYAG